MSLEKDETLNAESKDKGGESTADSKTFTQDDLNRIIAKEEKKWKSTHGEVFTKAAEFEKLQEKLKQQQDAELSEIQKLQKERDELLPHKTKAETYEKYISTQYEELASELSEEDRETLNELSVSITEKLSLAKRLLAKSGVAPLPNGAARASASATASPDKLTALAEEKMSTFWPREVKGSESYKTKLERIKAELKALQT